MFADYSTFSRSLLVGHGKGNVFFLITIKIHFFVEIMDKLSFFFKYDKTAHSRSRLKSSLCLKKQLSSRFSVLKPHTLKGGYISYLFSVFSVMLS